MSITYENAKEIWKARWRRVALKQLVATYDADPRRFYEVWTEEVHRGSRIDALREFTDEEPALAAATDTTPHVPRRHVVPMSVEAEPTLFD